MFKDFLDHDLQWLHEATYIIILYNEFVQIALFS